jgi:hypothetical protein
MRALHLYVPGLLPAPPLREAACAGLRLPGLETLLARARTEFMPAIGKEAWLCQSFGVARQRDWPVAPLTLARDGIDPGNRYWLRADPVHLQLQRGRLTLIDGAMIRLTAEESEAIVQSLNLHLRDRGLRLLAPDPVRWYLETGHEPDLSTHPLSEVRGRRIDAYLPTGDAAAQWHSLSNEIQMLLHQHPVNGEREGRGALTVNSLWFWGGGRKTDADAGGYAAVWSDEPTAGAPGQAAALPVHSVPDTAAAWLEQAPDGTGLTVLNGLDAAAAYGNVLEWRQEIERLDQYWFSPLIGMLRRGNLASLRITATDDIREGLAVALSRRDLWRFWRRPRPFCSLLPG